MVLPLGILDTVGTVSGHRGCAHLLGAIRRVWLALHVFGHIHPSFGTVSVNGMVFVNAALAGSGYRLIRQPIVLVYDRHTRDIRLIEERHNSGGMCAKCNSLAKTRPENSTSRPGRYPGVGGSARTHGAGPSKYSPQCLRAAKQMGYDEAGMSDSACSSRAPPQPTPDIVANCSQPLVGATFGATPKIEFPENNEIPYFPAFFVGFSMASASI